MVDLKRRELGDFLRARRSRLTPESVGLPRHRQRRTPGLRREEVAERAGIGVDWYIRLEQGRPVTPSLTTIDALARALKLTELEHEHLRAQACAAAVGDEHAPCGREAERGVIKGDTKQCADHVKRGLAATDGLREIQRAGDDKEPGDA